MTTEEQAVADLMTAIENIRPAVDALHRSISENADTEAYALLVLLSSAAKDLDEYVLERCIFDEAGDPLPMPPRDASELQ